MSFAARHESGDSDAAAALLDRLERFRTELSERFEETPWGVAVVIHRGALELSLAQPWLPLAWLTAAPASRRYLAGWFATGEIHVLRSGALRRRASKVPGSLEALQLSPLHEYAHLVIGANNDELPPPFTPASFRRYLEWAWLCEGAASYFCGQSVHLRPAIARRLKEGPPPAFPPAARDAPLLGGTLFELLERRRGGAACVALVSRLYPAGARAAIEHAFRSDEVEVEAEWRQSLSGLRAR